MSGFKLFLLITKSTITLLEGILSFNFLHLQVRKYIHRGDTIFFINQFSLSSKLVVEQALEKNDYLTRIEKVRKGSFARCWMLLYVILRLYADKYFSLS